MKEKVLISLNDITQQAISGHYDAHGGIGDGHCVIAFSFGYRKMADGIEPGISNQDLAKFIEVNIKNKPLILQFEIADALRGNYDIYRIEKHRRSGEYLGTDEGAKQAFDIMKSKNWKTAIIVAHPHHIPRVDAVCRMLGIETIVPKGLEKIRFDPESDQEWTKNKEAWAIRERLAIKFYSENGLI